MSRKVLLIGLDAAPPKLVFEKFRKDLPNISKLIQDGAYARMRSTHPPITIPAWAAMVTGKNPGKLGMYGFRHRKKGAYNDFYIVSSLSVKEPAIWDIIGEQGLRSVVISVPPGYPPKKINGFWISCFITPGPEKEYTYPPQLKQEIESKFGPFIFDVVFRTEKRRELIKNLYKMTEQHFDIVEYLMREKWDFFMFVEIGVDRVQHAFWKFFDKEHHLYTPGNEFENVIPDYYKYIDQRIGRILNLIDDETVVIVASDHGAKRMKGAFVINEWLADQGYLEFRKEPEPGTDLAKAEINWDQTIAWGWGGYYARVFINLKGREPHGVVKEEDFEDMREQLINDFKKIRDQNGNEMDNKVYRPQELFPVLNGDPPDLFVYFDDLYWRSAGTVGYGTYYLPENDKGPDDAVHDWDGILIIYDPQETIGKRNLGEVSIFDVAPTILDFFGIKFENDMDGRSLLGD
ncbi:MAG: alkaline phosphatase family protein [Candidatus Njordarchaeales archaeon]